MRKKKRKKKKISKIRKLMMKILPLLTSRLTIDDIRGIPFA